MLQLFYRTHTLTVLGLGGAMWTQAWLPRAGGVGQQDARTMAHLEVLRAVQNRLLIEDSARQPKTKKPSGAHD